MITYANGQEVHYNYDRGVNFSSYKTYQWVDLADGRVPDQLIDRDIKRAVDEQLTQKGLTRVEKDADIYVSYQAVITLEKSLNLSGSSGDFGGWDPWGGGWRTGSVQGQTSTIPVGMLVISFYDPGKKQLIWRGDASKTIDVKKDPDKNYKNLRKTMTKLFKNYPPRPGK
jgi:hypothetical protein